MILKTTRAQHINEIFLSEKIFVDAGDEANKIWTTSLHNKVRETIVSAYSRYGSNNKRKFNQELLHSLNDLDEFKENRIIFELRRNYRKSTKFLFTVANTYYAVKKRDLPKVGIITIYLNSTYPLNALSSSEHLEQSISSLSHIIYHEMTHRLQYEPLHKGSLFNSLWFVWRIKVLFHDKRGIWFVSKKNQDINHMPYVEISAYANETAHGILNDPNSPVWKLEIIRYVLNQPPKIASLFIQTVYNLLTKSGMTYDEIRKVFGDIENFSHVPILKHFPKNTSRL